MLIQFSKNTSKLFLKKNEARQIVSKVHIEKFKNSQENTERQKLRDGQDLPDIKAH